MVIAAAKMLIRKALVRTSSGQLNAPRKKAESTSCGISYKGQRSLWRHVSKALRFHRALAESLLHG